MKTNESLPFVSHSLACECTPMQQECCFQSLLICIAAVIIVITSIAAASIAAASIVTMIIVVTRIAAGSKVVTSNAATSIVVTSLTGYGIPLNESFWSFWAWNYALRAYASGWFSSTVLDMDKRRCTDETGFLDERMHSWVIRRQKHHKQRP